MKKLYPEAIDVSQGTANRAVRIIERHFRQARVERARDLSEEARVRLFRDLRDFLDAESNKGNQITEKWRKDGLWTRFLKRLEDFLSFSDGSPNSYAPFTLWPCVAFCDGFRLSMSPAIRVGKQE